MKDRLSTFGILVFLIAVVIGVTYYAYMTYQRTHNLRSASDAAQTLATSSAVYQTLSGDTVDMAALVGKPIIVTSFASWSPESADNLRLLEQIASSGDTSEVIYIAINRKEIPQTAEQYLSTIGELTHLSIVLDPQDSFYSAVDGYAMPETLFYDRSGTIREHHRGRLSEQFVRDTMGVITANQ